MRESLLVILFLMGCAGGPKSYNAVVSIHSLPVEIRLNLSGAVSEGGKSALLPEICIGYSPDSNYRSMELLEMDGFVKVFSSGSGDSAYLLRPQANSSGLPLPFQLTYAPHGQGQNENRPLFYGVALEAFQVSGGKIDRIEFQFNGKVKLMNGETVSIQGDGELKPGRWQGPA